MNNMERLDNVGVFFPTAGRRWLMTQEHLGPRIGWVSVFHSSGLTFVYFIILSLPLVSFILVWTSCLRGLWCYTSPSLDGWQKPYLVTLDLSMKNQQQVKHPNHTTDWASQTETAFQIFPLSPDKHGVFIQVLKFTLEAKFYSGFWNLIWNTKHNGVR